MSAAPGLDAIRRMAADLSDDIIRTPVVRWRGPDVDALWPDGAEVWAKCEMMQVTGTFKARGVLANLKALAPEARARGVTGFSAGNHALALIWGAGRLGIPARLFVPEKINRFRLQRCHDLGGDVVLCPDIHSAVEQCMDLVATQGRSLIHPFEGPGVAVGTGTLGLEVIDQIPDVEAVVIAIGGGGLAGGMANAIRQARPEVEIYGVEPEGADSMSRSLKAGTPQAIDQVRSIADSLGAPKAEPYSFALCRDNIDAVVTVSDAAMIAAMQVIYKSLKVVAEPACAASVAAVAGPLRDRLAGKRTCVLLCGSNMGVEDYMRLTGALQSA